MRFRGLSAFLVTGAITATGCGGNETDAYEAASEETGTPLCSEILDGTAEIPESGNCIDDEER